MFGGVLVLGRIAAAHVAANQAQAQVDPGVSSFHALLTHVLVCVSKLDLIQMAAFSRHRFLQGENHDSKSSHFGHVT
jgi:precorrin-6B methylase 1